jgi:hypothetical protein
MCPETQKWVYDLQQGQQYSQKIVTELKISKRKIDQFSGILMLKAVFLGSFDKFLLNISLLVIGSLIAKT